MDNVKESLAKDMPVSSGLPPPKQILNQSSEYQVIEKAAKLLKTVEQHWKKSLFQNRLQFSPISESLNSSESEHYIEKLAAIKFKDASFRNKQNFPVGELQPGYRREGSLEQNLLMSYDVVSNYFDLAGAKDGKSTNHPFSARTKEENNPVKCRRCLDKAQAQNELQKKSVSVLPRQQYVLKQNSFSRRGVLERQSRGGLSMQVSPRSNESLPTSRTYASAYSSPRNKTNLSLKSRMSSSNPDLRKLNTREHSASRHPKVPKCCHNFCSTDRLNKLSENYNRSEISQVHPEIVDMSNVSVVNIKSRNQEDSTIPEVNPRKAPTLPDKMIIIQHLPQVDIRPELSKQTGPVISIEAETVGEEQKDPKSANIGVFNYIHKNETKSSQKEFKPFSNYTRYRRLSGNNGCSEEASFAAQLELRSVAENFIYRLKKNDNPSGLVLMSTLLLLMDEVNELIDAYMSDSTNAPKDPNLPPRMEMVSDLLSDELKTWGAQLPSHYQSLNNIIQHLILDMHYAKYGNFDLKELSNAVNQINTTSSKKSSILKTRKNNLNFDHSGRQRHISLNGETNYERERSEATYRSTHSEEMSLSEKLLQENALKVQRLEKAYKINHRVRILQKKEETSHVESGGVTNNFREQSKDGGHADAVEDEDKTEPSDDSKRQTSSNSFKSDGSHPVVAIVSPSHEDSAEEDDQYISEKVSEAEDGSADEEHQEDEEDKDEPIPEEENSPSKPAEEPESQDENHTDKQVSDVEEEVEEALSESSQPPAEELKDSPASDYDEDFEVDDTENQSQSVSVPTTNDKEKIGKRSRSQTMGVDEVCQTDVIDFPLITHTDINKNIKQSVDESRSEVSLVKLRRETKMVLNERCNNGQFTVENSENGQNLLGSVVSPKHLWHNAANKNKYKELLKPLANSFVNENSEKILTNNPENKENNFVKVHVRDELGEIILSYAGTKQTIDNKSMSSNTQENLVPEIQPVQSVNVENKLPIPSYNMNNYIENERKILENLTSNVLKELLGNKIHEILSKYMGDDKCSKREEKDNLPSTSRVPCSNEKSVQTILETSEFKLDADRIPNPLHEIRQERNKDDNDYQLKSPALKLNSDNELLLDKDFTKEKVINKNVGNLIKTAEEENLQNVESSKEELKDFRDVGSYSPEVKLLISMVEEMDSSEVEYCEASLKLTSDEETKTKPEVNNKNLRLHHFNSDEFLVYPRLNPQPSDIKVLHYSKIEDRIETSGDSKKSEEEFRISKRTDSISVKNVSTECNIKNFRLHPIPETDNLLPKIEVSTSSTQTVAPSRSTKPLTLPSASNLVELIEISYSQSSSSSSCHSQKGKAVKFNSESSHKMAFPIRPIPDERIKEFIPPNDPAVEVNCDSNLPLVGNYPSKPEKSEPSSTAHSEINSPNLFNHLNNERKISGRNVETSEQSNEISSTSTDTERSTPSDLVENQCGLSAPMMRVLEMSAARANAWSSSSDSTTDDEKIFILNQPVSDDEVLDDLEQLMDYLKNSKSSTSNVRMRLCSRHKKL